MKSKRKWIKWWDWKNLSQYQTIFNLITVLINIQGWELEWDHLQGHTKPPGSHEKRHPHKKRQKQDDNSTKTAKGRGRRAGRSRTSEQDLRYSNWCLTRSNEFITLIWNLINFHLLQNVKCFPATVLPQTASLTLSDIQTLHSKLRNTCLSFFSSEKCKSPYVRSSLQSQPD